MANTLGNYNPIFYVQEGLPILEKALGLGGRVYRGLDDSNSSREKGDTATIKVPGSFVAQDAPSAAQDLAPTKIDVKLDQWKEVKFALTDKELAYTQQAIINDHVRPAIYALVDKIDISIAQRYVDIPWFMDWSNPAAVVDITGFNKILFNNKSRERGRMHCMVDGQIESELLALAAFSQQAGAGDAGVLRSSPARSAPGSATSSSPTRTCSRTRPRPLPTRLAPSTTVQATRPASRP
jgi:hypothetical protein